MSDDLLNDLREIFKIEHDTSIEFKELYGFTFAFMTKISRVREIISSAEIKPVGIIYKENGEYYFAPIDERVKIEEVIREYVKTIPEEECSHYQQ